MDETTIAEMRARATAAKERIDAVEEGEVDEPEFDEVVAAAAMFANDAAKLAEDVDALTKEVERLERRLGEAGELYGMARFDEDKLRSEVERLTKANNVWESERRRIEGALDAAGLHDVETTLTSRIERTCQEVVNGRQIDKQLQAFLDLHESDFDALRGARPSPLVRIEKLADERDKLKAEVERLRASREEARIERDEFGRDVERLTEERDALNAKLVSLEPLIDALFCADRQELPRDLADRVTAYVKALPCPAVTP